MRTDNNNIPCQSSTWPNHKTSPPRPTNSSTVVVRRSNNAPLTVILQHRSTCLSSISISKRAPSISVGVSRCCLVINSGSWRIRWRIRKRRLIMITKPYKECNATSPKWNTITPSQKKKHRTSEQPTKTCTRRITPVRRSLLCSISWGGGITRVLCRCSRRSWSRRVLLSRGERGVLITISIRLRRLYAPPPPNSPKTPAPPT